MIAVATKVPDNEQILSINNEMMGTTVLNKDDKFLFEYLPLTPFVEEEFKKKEEQARASQNQAITKMSNC